MIACMHCRIDSVSILIVIIIIGMVCWIMSHNYCVSANCDNVILGHVGTTWYVVCEVMFEDCMMVHGQTPLSLR